MKQFKPELIPNSKTGKEFELTKNIVRPFDYMASLKHDGGRVEIPATGPGLSRELKVLASGHIQAMVKDIQDNAMLCSGDMLECEFYSPEMTFSEIMHFFKSEDVTSDKKKKYWAKEWEKTNQGTSTYTKTKNGKPYEQGWEFEGRTPEWLTTWHESLKLYAFNLVNTNNLGQNKMSRNTDLLMIVRSYNDHSISTNLRYIEQYDFQTHLEIENFYKHALYIGEEGIVLVRKDALYKYGRHTMNSGNIFKIKEDKLEFDGVIVSVEEATEAREGAEKTINELGRSKTSQLKEDRIPSGIAKGFLIVMEDGRGLTVSLNGYSVEEKRSLLVNASRYVGQTIRFTGMEPVKHGGVPRQARFTKGNFRDAK